MATININNKEVQQNNEIKFAGNVNYTDPVVLHDPEIKVASIIEPYNPQNTSNDPNYPKHDGPIDPIKINAIRFPEIRINHEVIKASNIISMNLNYREFIPSIVLKVLDYDNYIRFNGLIQMNNELNVIFTTPLDGIYKKVSLRFYIYDQTFDEVNNIVTYYASYKFEKFNTIYHNDLIFNGCSKCKVEKSSQLSTWEMLHTISNLTGFGFATTDKCKDINDKLSRIMFAKNYKDFLIDQKQWAGFNEDSIFDYWIDLYGYIVLVNLSYLFNEDVKMDQLSIYSIPSINFEFDNTPEKKPTQVVRMLTNFKPVPINQNMSFTEYSFDVSNGNATNRAFTHTTCFDINNGKYSISQNDIEIIQDSIDGQYTEEYAKQFNKPIYVNFNNYDINLQKEVRKSFFAKHRQRILKIKMDHMNLGIQRGTLIFVTIYEASPKQKKIILEATSNTYKHDKIPYTENDLKPDYQQNIENNEEQLNIEKIINDGKTMLINMAYSGLYYVDGMSFYYDNNSQEIEQYLYLIKQRNLNSFYNKYTLIKYNESSK